METRYPGNFNLTIEIMKEVEQSVKKPLDYFPRRNNMSRWISQEFTIYNAIQEVEKLGADVLLTDAVILLSQAQDKIADYVEKAKLVYPSKASYDEWMKKHNLVNKVLR